MALTSFRTMVPQWSMSAWISAGSSEAPLGSRRQRVVVRQQPAGQAALQKRQVGRVQVAAESGAAAVLEAVAAEARIEPRRPLQPQEIEHARHLLARLLEHVLVADVEPLLRRDRGVRG